LTLKRPSSRPSFLCPRSCNDSRANGVLLEEIELSDDGSQWLVTISVPSPAKPSFSALMEGGGQVQDRDFKLIRIDSETGKVASIKIRKV
jgi:hypothetical protein